MKTTPCSRCLRAVLLLAPLLVTLLAPLGCTCNETLTDEQRLKQMIDTTSVHLYVATKVALSKAGTDPDIKQARQRLLGLIRAVGHSGASAKWGAELERHRGKLSLAELGALVKAVWKLKQTGQRLVREDKDDELQPLLPLLLARLHAPQPLLQATADRNTDHALFLLVTGLLKMHPRSPVPIPAQVVLYEAWNTDPAALRLPGLKVPTHALKAWTYGNSDLCDLAQKESAALDGITFQRRVARDALQLMSGEPAQALVQHLEGLDTATRALGHGGLAICQLKRGHDRQARPALKRLVDDLQRLGVAPDELDFIRSVVDCGGDAKEISRGKARLKQLSQRLGAQPGQRADLDALQAYCEASAETSGELARKISLAGRLVRVAAHHAQQHGGGEALQRSPIFKAVGGFASVCSLTAKGLDGAASLKNKAKGLLERLHQ